MRATNFIVVIPLAISGLIVSIGNSLILSTHYLRYFDATDFMFLEKLFPILLMVLGLALILRRVKIGLWISVYPQVFYLYRAISVLNKTNPQPSQNLADFLISYGEIYITILCLFFTIFLVLVFGKTVRKHLSLTVRNITHHLAFITGIVLLTLLLTYFDFAQTLRKSP